MPKYIITRGPDRLTLANALFLRGIGPCFNGPSANMEVQFTYVADDAFNLVCTINSIGKAHDWNMFNIHGTCSSPSGEKKPFTAEYDPASGQGVLAIPD